MKYILCVFCFYSIFSYAETILPDEIAKRCKEGGGCVIMLESDFKAALVKAAKGVCPKDTKWKS